MNKSNKLFICYILFIIVALVLIMFILPDSFFTSSKNNLSISESNNQKSETTSLAKQKENLLKSNYNYEYSLLVGTKTYSCTGKIEDSNEEGTCTLPEEISYTEKNKDEVFANIENEYLEPSKIFALIKDISPKEFEYSGLKEYEYQTKIKDLNTTISIFSDNKEITEIRLSNISMTYQIKYSNMSY